MKKLILLFLCLSFAGASFAARHNNSTRTQRKVYPMVSVHDIQYVPQDSLVIADSLQNSVPSRWGLQTSHYVGDTVTVTAICYIPGRVITYTAQGFTMMICDTQSTSLMNPFTGMLVRVNTADSSQAILDGFLNVQRGDIIQMTGLISEFPTSSMNSTTQFQPIPTIPIDILGSAPIPGDNPITACDIYQGSFPNGKVHYTTGEQWEGNRVVLTNLIVTAIINASRGTFSAVDENGCNISSYDMSHYFTLGHGNPIIPGDTAYVNRIWPRIQVGTLIDTLRGTVSTASGQENARGYRICPLLPGDLVVGVRKPLAFGHRRYPVIVPSDSTPRIQVNAKEGDNSITTVELLYNTNGGSYQSVSMTATDDTTYSAHIPAQAENTVVTYFVKVTDDGNYVSVLANSAVDGSQTDTSKGFFFYQVLNRPLTVEDVQFTPFINGRSGYLGGVTEIAGYVTADTANLMLAPLTSGGTNAWYIQDSSSAWNGIWVTGPESVLAIVKNNDYVRVTGTIQEQFNNTRLGNVTRLTVVSTGNPKRIPVKLHTGRFGPPIGNGNHGAEPYEGTLVQFDSVTVTSVNPTFADPTEYEVDDGSGPILVRRDGRNTFSNVEADTTFGYTIIHVGDKLESLVGIILFNNNRYKVVPRTDTDITSLTGIVERESGLPKGFSLYQNYPNPFNPTTNFAYDIPTSGFVTLKVFNVLGQEVATVVNQQQNVGKYSVNFNASQLSSGMYFYRLTVGTFAETKKMILMK